MATEGVVRDSSGLALYCYNVRMGFGSHLLAELKAIWHSLQVSLTKDWHRIVIETDS